jgi:predicted DNA binding CopG/RHH family protein
MNDMHNSTKDNAWDNRELGATEQFVRKASLEQEKAVDDKMALQIISIRLQKNLVDELKELAIEDGLGYQPYVRQVLSQHVRSEKRKRERQLRVVKR